HARRGAGQALRRSHRRHGGRQHRLRRPAAGLDRHVSEAHLRRRGLARMNTHALPTTAPFRLSNATRVALFALLVYTVYALAQLDFSLARFVVGLGQGAKLISRMFPPDLTKGDILWKGIAESLQIAVLASAAGILISLPVGLLGARNLMPAWATWIARGTVAVCRSLHPVIVAILFVKAVGFGALAGVLALVV